MSKAKKETMLRTFDIVWIICSVLAFFSVGMVIILTQHMPLIAIFDLVLAFCLAESLTGKMDFEIVTREEYRRFEREVKARREKEKEKSPK